MSQNLQDFYGHKLFIPSKKYQRPPQGHAVATLQSPREFRDLASSE